MAITFVVNGRPVTSAAPDSTPLLWVLREELKLTGTNYVEIPGSSNKLQFANGSLSIAGWFKVDNFDKSWQALIAKGENSNYRIARRFVEREREIHAGVARLSGEWVSVDGGGREVQVQLRHSDGLLDVFAAHVERLG